MRRPGRAAGETKSKDQHEAKIERIGHEAGRQKVRLKLRGSDVFPHLKRFIITDETGIVGNFCCADLRQMVSVSIKEETSDLGLVLEAEVLSQHRSGLRGDLGASLE